MTYVIIGQNEMISNTYSAVTIFKKKCDKNKNI